MCRVAALVLLVLCAACVRPALRPPSLPRTATLQTPSSQAFSCPEFVVFPPDDTDALSTLDARSWTALVRAPVLSQPLPASPLQLILSAPESVRANEPFPLTAQFFNHASRRVFWIRPVRVAVSQAEPVWLLYATRVSDGAVFLHANATQDPFVSVCGNVFDEPPDVNRVGFVDAHSTLAIDSNTLQIVLGDASLQLPLGTYDLQLVYAYCHPLAQGSRIPRDSIWNALARTVVRSEPRRIVVVR